MDNDHLYLLIYSIHKIFRNAEIFKKLENEV
jgi:hypothetical protein